MKKVSIILAALLLILPVVGTSCSKKNNQVQVVENDPAGQNLNVYNVLDFGATGNRTNDTAAIQKALDAAAEAGGGTVYIPTGIYVISRPLVKPAKVSIKGNNMWTTNLQWMGNDNGVIIDTSNQDLSGTSIENLMFTNGNASKDLTCILGGSTRENNNSSGAIFRDLLFNHVPYGIRGNAEPDGYGISNSLFENVFASGCTYGFWLFGSGNTIVHPRLATCEVALVFDHLNENSYAGVSVIGGIFASNKTDIMIPNPNFIDTCTFVGTWFEDSKKAFLSVPNPDTRIKNLTFRDCMLNSKVGMGPTFNAANILGTITISSCTIYDSFRFSYPTNPESKLILNDIQGYLTTEAAFQLHDKEKGFFVDSGDNDTAKFRIPHKLKAQPASVKVTPASEDAAEEYYVTADETYIFITFKNPPKKGDKNVKFYWEVIR